MLWGNARGVGTGLSSKRLAHVRSMVLTLVSLSLLSCSGSGSAPSGSVEPVAGTSEVVLISLPDGTTVPARPDELIVTFYDTVTAEQKQAVQDYLKAHNAVVVDEIPEIPSIVIRVKPTELLSLLDALGGFAGVWIVAPNMVIPPALNPDPSGWPSNLWVDLIRARDAWNLTVGSEGVPIVILDNFFLHLVPQDHKTITPLTRSPFLGFGDTVGHGTWVAAIAGATGNDKKGIAGLAWNSPLYGGELETINGYFDADDIRKAILTAVSTLRPVFPNQPIILNMSIGYDDRFDALTYRSIQEFWYDILVPAIRTAAKSSDFLLVIAVGNSRDKVPTLNDPLPYDKVTSEEEDLWNDHVVVVGGVNEAKVSYSTQGRAVSISAPATNISMPTLTTILAKDGTSLAAPQVAGTAALVSSLNPTMKAKEIKARLIDTACPVNGIKILNAWRAVDPLVSEQEGCVLPPPPPRPDCIWDADPLTGRPDIYINCARTVAEAYRYTIEESGPNRNDSGYGSGQAQSTATGTLSYSQAVSRAIQTEDILPVSPLRVSATSSCCFYDADGNFGGYGLAVAEAEIKNQWVSIYDPARGTLAPGKATLHVQVELVWNPTDITSSAGAFMNIEAPLGQCYYQLRGTFDPALGGQVLSVATPDFSDPHNCLTDGIHSDAYTSVVTRASSSVSYPLDIPLTFLYGQPFQLFFKGDAWAANGTTAIATLTITGIDIDGGLSSEGGILAGDQAAVGVGQ